jgi:hypothetical protein
MTMGYRTCSLFVALTSFSSLITGSVSAHDIGARAYVQPWLPERPLDDHVLLPPAVDKSSAISDAVKNGWDKIKGALTWKIISDLNGRRLASGVYMAATVQLSEPSDFSLTPTGENGATLGFIIPQTKIALNIATKAAAEADKYTLDMASKVTDAVFDVALDIVISVNLSLDGNADPPIVANSVHALIRNAQVAPRNDAAKALKITSDIIDFITGIDLVNIVQRELDSKDLANGSLVDSINVGLAALDGPFRQAKAQAAAAGRAISTTLWADSNRVTANFARAPITNPPADGSMTGRITWDPKAFPSAICSSFMVAGHVQIGPRPLIASNGEEYGDAPMLSVGRFSDQPASDSSYVHGTNQCNYTLSAAPRGWPLKPTATTTATAPNSEGSNNPLVGGLHTEPVLQPVGWDGESAVPDAANKDYELVRAMSGAAGVGDPRPVRPGVKNESLKSGIDPVEAVMRGQAETRGNSTLPNAPVTHGSEQAPREAPQQVSPPNDSRRPGGVNTASAPDQPSSPAARLPSGRLQDRLNVGQGANASELPTSAKLPERNPSGTATNPTAKSPGSPGAAVPEIAGVFSAPPSKVFTDKNGKSVTAGELRAALDAIAATNLKGPTVTRRQPAVAIPDMEAVRRESAAVIAEAHFLAAEAAKSAPGNSSGQAHQPTSAPERPAEAKASSESATRLSASTSGSQAHQPDSAREPANSPAGVKPPAEGRSSVGEREEAFRHQPTGVREPANSPAGVKPPAEGRSSVGEREEAFRHQPTGVREPANSPAGVKPPAEGRSSAQSATNISERDPRPLPPPPPPPNPPPLPPVSNQLGDIGQAAAFTEKRPCSETDPYVASVTGTLTPGSAIGLKGVCFGNSGEVRVLGKDTNLLIVLQVAVWTDTVLAASVPADLSGVIDQAVDVELVRADGRKSRDIHRIFIAAKDPEIELPTDVIVSTACGPDGQCGNRQAVHRTDVVSGTSDSFSGNDSWQIQLAKGWQITTLTTYNQVAGNLTESGFDTGPPEAASFSYAFTSTQIDVPHGFEIFLTGDDSYQLAKYSVMVKAVGPRGVPMRPQK